MALPAENEGDAATAVGWGVEAAPYAHHEHDEIHGGPPSPGGHAENG
jgi:hypothetical protein